MSETISIPKGFASSKERGIRWFAIWNVRTNKRDDPQFLCPCRSLVTVQPEPDGTLEYSHDCGFSGVLMLEEYAKALKT